MIVSTIRILYKNCMLVTLLFVHCLAELREEHPPEPIVIKEFHPQRRRS
jgi:hypothetical protein